MNKKSHKKKNKRRPRHSEDGRNNNKENIDQSSDNEQNFEQDEQNVEQKKPCYDVKVSDVMGRYLVANRQIYAGEVIIEEQALAVGPCAGCSIICLGCYRHLDLDSIHKCSRCKWPLCSQSCIGYHKYTGHSQQECDTLKNITPPYKDLELLKECYQALMPLRCLYLKEKSPEKWKKLSIMEAHNDLRRTRTDIWAHNQTHVVERITKDWNLKYSEDEIHTVCGILEVNAFEVGGSNANARAVYNNAYLLAHDCVPTTTHTDDESKPGRPLVIRAATSHEKGDMITLCYAFTLQGTLKRREHLIHSKFFSCVCQRCSDPTELGTMCSALRCPVAKCTGVVIPIAPLDITAPWMCDVSTCRYTVPADGVQMLLKRLTDEFDQIDANDVKAFENFIYKFRNVLHRNHYLFLSAKHSLSQLYGKVSDYMIHEMPDAELNRKIDICRDLMKIFDVIEPGYSRLRGVTLYELHAPLMILTTRDFEKKSISKDNLRKRLKEIVKCLSESALILGFESPNSSEGLMASAAKDALKKIKTWEQIIGKIS